MTRVINWLCPRCHKRGVLPEATRGPMACPNCRASIRRLEERPKISPRLLPLWRRWAAFKSRQWDAGVFPLAAIVFALSAAAAVTWLGWLWFDLSGPRIWAAWACLLWLGWCLYRIALWNWPVVVWRDWHDLARFAAVLLLMLSSYLAACGAYLSTARVVARFQYDALTIEDWSTFGGERYWFRATYERPPMKRRWEGPVARSGEWHGRWEVPPWLVRWYWYGQLVTEKEWHRRDELMRVR